MRLRVVARLVDFIHGEHYIFVQSFDELRERPVFVHHAGLAVHEEDHRVRAFDRAFGLALNPASNFVVFDVQPSRINHFEHPATPSRYRNVPVAGGVSDRAHDGPSFLHDSVPERGFAHVGAADDDDGREV